MLRVGAVAIASDGTCFLVFWTSAPDDSSTTEIRGVRFLPDGVGGGTLEPPGGFLVADGPNRKSLRAAAFADGTFLVSWIERGIVRGARIGVDETSARTFTIDEGPAHGLALASDGRRFLVVVNRARSERFGSLWATFVATAVPLDHRDE